MARIRTIKPEFFTSEDIVGLPAITRLLYIAIWCEADKEGRLPWKPATFKLRYFPADNCDIKTMCQELVDAGLVVLYGDGLAYIPSFSKHQHLNPRESKSILPSPSPEPDSAPEQGKPDASVTRDDASNLDVHAQGGREGKGREGNTRDASSDAYEPEGFKTFWADWPRSHRKGGKVECLKFWRDKRLEAQAPEILMHLRTMKESRDWTKDSGDFIPAPVVYLRARRWDGAEVGETPASRFAGAI